MAYNEILTESGKWDALNKCLCELSKSLDKEFKDYPDIPEVQSLVKELRLCKRDKFIEWMKQNHPGEVPEELLYPEVEDSDGGHVPDWAFSHR